MMNYVSKLMNFVLSMMDFIALHTEMESMLGDFNTYSMSRMSRMSRTTSTMSAPAAIKTINTLLVAGTLSLSCWTPGTVKIPTNGSRPA